MYKNILDGSNYISNFFSSYYQEEVIDKKYIIENLFEQILYSINEKVSLDKKSQEKWKSIGDSDYLEGDKFLQNYIPNYQDILKTAVSNIILEHFDVFHTSKKVL